MNILIGLLYVVEVVVCLLLALVVMLQKPKEGGLGGLAGGMGEAVFGADAGNVLIKATIWLGAIFLVNTLLLARFTSTVHAKTLMRDEPAAAPQQQTPDFSQMPAAQVPAPAAAPAAPEKPAAPAPAAAPAAPAKPAAPAPAAAPAAPAKPAAPAPKAPAPAPEKPAAPAPKAPAAK